MKTLIIWASIISLSSYAIDFGEYKPIRSRCSDVLYDTVELCIKAQLEKNRDLNLAVTSVDNNIWLVPESLITEYSFSGVNRTTEEYVTGIVTLQSKQKRNDSDCWPGGYKCQIKSVEFDRD